MPGFRTTARSSLRAPRSSSLRSQPMDWGGSTPPQGPPPTGTTPPAEGYQVSQVSTGDVVLGDITVPTLMQTDVFGLMVKDKSFRALATNPAFMALAQENPKALAAIAQNPAAF